MMTIYNCEQCKQPIHRNEQAKCHSSAEDGAVYFFHVTGNCFILWEATRHNMQHYRAQAIAEEFEYDMMNAREPA